MRLRKDSSDFQLFPDNKTAFRPRQPQFPDPARTASLQRFKRCYQPYVYSGTAADNIRQFLSAVFHIPSEKIPGGKIIVIQDLGQDLLIRSVAETPVSGHGMSRSIGQSRQVIIIPVFPTCREPFGHASAAFGKSGIAYLRFPAFRDSPGFRTAVPSRMHKDLTPGTVHSISCILSRCPCQSLISLAMVIRTYIITSVRCMSVPFHYPVFRLLSISSIRHIPSPGSVISRSLHKGPSCSPDVKPRHQRWQVVHLIRDLSCAGIPLACNPRHDP